MKTKLDAKLKHTKKHMLSPPSMIIVFPRTRAWCHDDHDDNKYLPLLPRMLISLDTSADANASTSTIKPKASTGNSNSQSNDSSIRWHVYPPIPFDVFLSSSGSDAGYFPTGTRIRAQDTSPDSDSDSEGGHDDARGDGDGLGDVPISN
jgi:hypothetical protein